MQTKKKTVDEITAELEKGVKTVFTSENYLKYLKTMSRFHRYSLNNTILIWLQKPDASLVAGYAAWQKKFNRFVKKGEKGIRIIAPIFFSKKTYDEQNDDEENRLRGFRVSTVFDISQTEGEDLPAYMIDSLPGTVENAPLFLYKLLRASPVPVFFADLKGSVKGYYHPLEKQITVSRNISKLHQIKTLVHEIAHSLMHDTKEKSQSYNREVEAESVAYTVCSYFGFDTSEYSFPYIAGWSASLNTDELKQSLERIRRTSLEIIDRISLNDSLPNENAPEILPA